MKNDISTPKEMLNELVEAVQPFMTSMMSQALSKTSDDTLMRLEILTPDGHALKFKAELWKKICRITQQYKG